MINKETELIYVGFNSRVAALNRHTGEIAWDWKSPRGRGYVSLLLLKDHRLIVSVIGYTYCLNALTGEQLWFNELSGFGSGVVSMVAPEARNPHDSIVAAAAETEQRQSSSASTTSSTT